MNQQSVAHSPSQPDGPEISCLKLSFSINPLMTQSEASFVIRNPHDKPLCIYTNHSASEAVMSLSLQTSWQLKR